MSSSHDNKNYLLHLTLELIKGREIGDKQITHHMFFTFSGCTDDYSEKKYGLPIMGFNWSFSQSDGSNTQVNAPQASVNYGFIISLDSIYSTTVLQKFFGDKETPEKATISFLTEFKPSKTNEIKRIMLYEFENPRGAFLNSFAGIYNGKTYTIDTIQFFVTNFTKKIQFEGLEGGSKGGVSTAIIKLLTK